MGSGKKEQLGSDVHVRADPVSLPQPCCVLGSLELQNLSGSGNARIIPTWEQTASVPISDSQTVPGCLCCADGTGLAPHAVVLGSNAHSETYLPIIVAGWAGGWLKGARKVSHDPDTPQGLCSSTSGLPLKKGTTFLSCLYK